MTLVPGARGRLSRPARAAARQPSVRTPLGVIAWVTGRSCGSVGTSSPTSSSCSSTAVGRPAARAERPVVGPAAPAEPGPGRRHRQPRHQQHVGVAHRVDAEQRTGRLEQPEPGRGQRPGPVYSAQSRSRSGSTTGSSTRVAGRAQALEERPGAGLASRPRRTPRRCARGVRDPTARAWAAIASASATSSASGRAGDAASSRRRRAALASASGPRTGARVVSARDEPTIGVMGSKGLDLARAKMQAGGRRPGRRSTRSRTTTGCSSTARPG